MASQRRRPGYRSGRAALFDVLRGLGRLAVVGLPVAIAPSPSSAALVDWLVLLIDASASIDADEYRLQHEAYVSVLQDPGIGALLAGAQVAVVEFATAPEVVVEWTGAPKEAARAYAGHTRERAGPGPASTTGIARALGLALDMLEAKPGRKVIDISGDGPDNVDWISGGMVATRARPRSSRRDQRPGHSHGGGAGHRRLLRRARDHGISRDLARAPRLRARAVDEDAHRDRRPASGMSEAGCFRLRDRGCDGKGRDSPR